MCKRSLVIDYFIIKWKGKILKFHCSHNNKQSFLQRKEIKERFCYHKLLSFLYFASNVFVGSCFFLLHSSNHTISDYICVIGFFFFLIFVRTIIKIFVKDNNSLTEFKASFLTQCVIEKSIKRDRKEIIP